MNAPVKVDLAVPQRKRPNSRPSSRPKHWDYREYYVDLAARTLSSIRKHRIFIVTCVSVAFMLACISTPLIPRKYSAEALISPNLFSAEQEKAVAKASIDGAAMVTGEARAIRSDVILRAAAVRLGHDPNAATSRSRPMLLLDRFRAAWLPETFNYSSFDRAVARLRNRVVVTNDTRSYLISVSFTASSAEEAAQVVNAVVIEYLRDKVRQRRLSKLISAEAGLQEQLAVYGEKHPKTLQAVADLEAERASIEAAMNQQDSDQYEVANDQNVKLAMPNHTPTSPKGFVIFGLSLLLALLASIGVAVWRDRRDEARQIVDCELRSR
jgi:uncharacterized protein involved in exopolysaccharide biosynthesis